MSLGTEKFGAPDPAVIAVLDQIDELDRLERLIRRILTANTWAELLATESSR
jgi:hypothetical protein